MNRNKVKIGSVSHYDVFSDGGKITLKSQFADTLPEIDFDDLAKEITPTERIANRATIPFNLNDWPNYSKYQK